MIQAYPHHLRKTASLLFMALSVYCADSRHICYAQNMPDKKNRLQLSRESASSIRWKTQIRWKDQEYDFEAGVAQVMNVIRAADKKPHPWNKATALGMLASLGSNLKGHPCLEELAKLYDGLGATEKGLILTCFNTSGDPRGIPVFMRTLDNEHDIKLRLKAAQALAGWNVRRGVAELVQLLDSDEPMPQPSQLYYVRDSAMRTFRLENIRKGWGFPDDEESASWPPDVTPPPDVAAGLKPPPAVEEIQKWFAENEHRFPDWKPGDPLPEIEIDDQNPEKADE